ncbi:MAG: LuxR family transcriptional regulator [Lautropia sp.]|nr:LuxR family transcriptional regulator [Lautropia sp.]
MEAWQEELLALAVESSQGFVRVFELLLKAAQAQDFEFVAYGFQAPLPASAPRVTLLNNYPAAWQLAYREKGYLAIDPVVRHARESTMPLGWSRKERSMAPAFWDEAGSHGIRFGWSQPFRDVNGSCGILSLARSAQALSTAELQEKQLKLQWLAQTGHMMLSRHIQANECSCVAGLTARERDVMKWTVDGKSAQDIADILGVSTSAVNLHISNVTRKLGVSNKTAAAVKALTLGLLA